LAKALTSVNGVTVVTAPKKGDGPEGLTLAVVQLGQGVQAAALSSAVAAAKTPHTAQAAPGVASVINGRLKADATATAVAEALKKAEAAGELKANSTPAQRRTALQKAGLV